MSNSYPIPGTATARDPITGMRKSGVAVKTYARLADLLADHPSLVPFYEGIQRAVFERDFDATRLEAARGAWHRELIIRGIKLVYGTVSFTFPKDDHPDPPPYGPWSSR